MKSLILKDLYNIGHNAKSMLITFIIYIIVFIPSSGVVNYIFVSTILCSVMIVTTFSYDNMAGWNRYALVTPVSRRDLVAAKFIVLIIFSAIGAGFGLITGTIGGAAMGKVTLNLEGICELLFLTAAAAVIGEILGSVTIPLIFKFGAEKARILLIVSFMVPVAICMAIGLLLRRAGVQVTDRFMFILLCFSPVIAVVWSLGMYKISCAVFSKQEV